MGDAFAYAGGAIWSAKESDRTYLFPYQPENEASVRELFAGHPEIILVPLNVALQTLILYTQAAHRDDPQEMLIPRDWQGTFTHVNTIYTKDSFRQGYEERGIPYIERWRSFPIDAAKNVEQIPVPKGDYNFLHDDVSRLMRIDLHKISGLQVIRPIFRRTMLAYRDLIEHAARIDVMDSAFFHMVEQFNPIGELFLHMYCRWYDSPKNDYLTRHNWNLVW
jgi:hypothetical protein